MKSQEGTSMELGMGMGRVPIHSYRVLSGRGGGGAREGAVRRSGRKDREEQRGPEARQVLPGKSGVELEMVTSLAVSWKRSRSGQRGEEGQTNELLLRDLLSASPPPLTLSTPSSTIPRPCLSSAYYVSALFSVLGTHGVERG